MGTDLERKRGPVLRFGGARVQWRRKYSRGRPAGGYRSGDEGRQSHAPGFTERSCRFDPGEGSAKRLGNQSKMTCPMTTTVVDRNVTPQCLFFKEGFRKKHDCMMAKIRLVGISLLFAGVVHPISIYAADRVRFAYPAKSLNYLPVTLGREKGIFQAEGIDLQMVLVASTIQVTALTTGDIDFSRAVPSDGRRRARAAGQGDRFFDHQTLFLVSGEAGDQVDNGAQKQNYRYYRGRLFHGHARALCAGQERSHSGSRGRAYRHGNDFEYLDRDESRQRRCRRVIAALQHDGDADGVSNVGLLR